MDNLQVLAVAKVYTKETVIGMGALKGAACQVQSVTDNGDGTQTLTLKWEDTTGASHTTDITLPSAIFAITSPTNGQTLRYNSVSGKFENSNVAFSAELDDLDDVTITTAQNKQVLQYNSTTQKWENVTLSFAADLADLGDVTIASLQNGQVLAYNSTDSKWENISLGSAASKDSTNAVTENDTDLVESGAVFTAIDDAVKALDVSDTAVAGSYVTEVSETDGKISVTREAADGTPTENSNKLLKSGGAFSALADKVDKVAGKGLSTNDFTDVLKDKLDGIEEGAQENVIEGIQLNGTALAPDANKAVNIEAVVSISVNGVAQTITDGATDLDVASNLITEAQWSTLSTLYDLN